MINKYFIDTFISNNEERSLKDKFDKKLNYPIYNPLNYLTYYNPGKRDILNFKIDPSLDVVFPRQNYLVQDSSAGILLNFVSDLFGELKTSFNKKFVSKGLSFSNTFINLNNINENTFDLQAEYRSNLQKVAKLFLNTYCRNYEIQTRITNLNSFIIEFNKFISLRQNNYITKQAFLLKNNFNHIKAGLGFEFNLEDANNDQEKYNNFLNDPYYSGFADLASRYGFYPNYMLPNQFICNINDSYVIQKAEKYIGKKDITFKTFNNFYFEKAKNTDFEDFIIFIGYLYNQFCFYYPSHVSFKVNNPEFMTITKNTRTELDYEELTKIINIDLFCDIYFYLRLIESKNKLVVNNTDIRASRQALNRALKTLDTPAKVRYIESQVRRYVLNQKLY